MLIVVSLVDTDIVSSSDSVWEPDQSLSTVWPEKATAEGKYG